eukprot:5706641-Amphidinium_carterae.2
MASSCGYTLGASQDDNALVTGVIEPPLGTADHADVYKVKQLYAECYMINALELRQQFGGYDVNPFVSFTLMNGMHAWPASKRLTRASS